MGENSKIEWCDHTFNPWIGCTKVSPGCANCYAESLSNRYGFAKWGKGNPRKRTSESNWRKPINWNRKAAFDDISTHRPRVFCASLADWLDDEIPQSWRADLLTLIYETPYLDWLLLTKRPQNYFKFFEGPLPDNVWIGTTVEDQTRADERILALLNIPARIRFLSCEPLLGSLDLRHHIGFLPSGWLCKRNGIPIIDWVICGGESGPGCRPMEIAWAESLAGQCRDAGVAFFMKQLGGARDPRHRLEDLPEHLRVRQFPA